MLYAHDSREFQCVQGICRLLGWPCDHSQHSSLLQTSKPPEKAADGNVPHVRWLQRFQNPYDDYAREHGMQVWSYGRTSEKPFCAQKSASSVLFQSGHSRRRFLSTKRLFWCLTKKQHFLSTTGMSSPDYSYSIFKYFTSLDFLWCTFSVLYFSCPLNLIISHDKLKPPRTRVAPCTLTDIHQSINLSCQLGSLPFFEDCAMEKRFCWSVSGMIQLSVS